MGRPLQGQQPREKCWMIGTTKYEIYQTICKTTDSLTEAPCSKCQEQNTKSNGLRTPLETFLLVAQIYGA
jgi:hypothetical protein